MLTANIHIAFGESNRSLLKGAPISGKYIQGKEVPRNKSPKEANDLAKGQRRKASHSIQKAVEVGHPSGLLTPKWSR